MKKIRISEEKNKKYQKILQNKTILQMFTGVNQVLRIIQKLLYPPRCVCCDALLGRLEDGCCPQCDARLPRILGPVCMKCGKPVVSNEKEYCDDCRKYAHIFDRGIAAFTYTGSLRRSVYRMKR